MILTDDFFAFLVLMIYISLGTAIIAVLWFALDQMAFWFSLWMNNRRLKKETDMPGGRFW